VFVLIAITAYVLGLLINSPLETLFSERDRLHSNLTCNLIKNNILQNQIGSSNNNQPIVAAYTEKIAPLFWG